MNTLPEALAITHDTVFDPGQNGSRITALKTTALAADALSKSGWQSYLRMDLVSALAAGSVADRTAAEANLATVTQQLQQCQIAYQQLHDAHTALQHKLIEAEAALAPAAAALSTGTPSVTDQTAVHEANTLPPEPVTPVQEAQTAG